MNVATWNIYWLGSTGTHSVQRTSDDERLIAEVIGRLAPDVLALQEIVDPLVMERVLKDVGNGAGQYCLRCNGQWLTSDSKPTDTAQDLQKVFLCLNQDTIELVRAAAIAGGPGGRRPLAATLRHRTSGREFVAVAVHLRSGFPGFLDAQDAAHRRQETEALIRWLRGEAKASNPNFPEPGLDDIMVMGDFNAQLVDPNHSLDPLQSDALSGWRLKNPEPDNERWETALYEGDRYIIDFMMFSQSAAGRLVKGPAIYAWDCDPALGGPLKFHEGPDGAGRLKSYGVSDHRPVFARLQY